MAIQLPGTPQQQKAQFSAFDTSSNFQSGLTKVGQALQQVGAGQVRIKQREEEEIERKEKAGQQMLAIESEEQFSKELNSLKQTMESAFNTGDLNTISNLEKQLSAFDPSGANFKINNFAPQNRRSDLTNEEYTRRAAVNMSKEYRRVSSALKSKRVLSETYQRTVDYTQQQSLAAMTHIKDNEGGVSNENLVAAIDSMAFNSKSQVVRNGTTVGQPRVIFDASVKSNIRKLMLHQFDNTEPLSEDELKSRMEGIRDIFGDPRYKDAGIVFDADDFKAVTEAYQEKLEIVSDKGYQSEIATETVKNATSSINLVMGSTVIEQGDISKIQARLATVEPGALNPTNQLKYESLSQLTSLFASPSPEYVDDFLEFEEGAKLASFDREAAQKTYNAFATDSSSPTHHDLLTQETPLAYSILEHVALQPKGGGYKVEDALKQLFTDNFSDITLQSAELSNFSSWVNGNVELLRKIGDNPVNIRVLSPELNELVKKAQGGDKEAWLLAENAYKDFVNSSPDLASIAPPKFYINQAQFPTTRLGDGTTFVNSVMTNVLQNGAVNTVSHASHQLKQGDIRDLELLRFQSEQLAANVIHSTNNPKAAEDAVSTLVSFYKSGTEFSKTADELYNNVYLQSQKFDKQDSGDVLPLIPLIEVYDNTGLPNKAEFYDTILRGYVNTYKVALAKLDDPEEQYEYIRDKLFEDTNVFPYVSITDGGGLVELPAEYNKYIDVRKDRTGLFGRFFEPAGRLLSDRESVKNVATVYSTAVISEMFDQNPSLNLDQILRDIREEVAPNIELDVSDPYVPVYAGGISAPETTQQKARREKKLKLRTREALIKGLMNNQVDGMPLARITTELQNDDEGNPQKVAILSVINKDGVYEPLARSPEDRRPVSASLDKVDVVMNSAMPRITTFMLGGSREDEAGVKTSMMGTPYYLRQLFGAEDTYISGMVEDVHDQIYNKD